MAHRGELPLLPGYSIQLDQPRSYHRPQTMAIENGIRTMKDEVKGELATIPFEKLQIGNKNILHHDHHNNHHHQQQQQQQQRQQQQQQKSHSLPLSTLPQWISQANLVLRYYAFFKEAVQESSIENWRVRRCVILFYLEDGTLQVSEITESNSGLAQNEFTLRRHRVPLSSCNGTSNSSLKPSSGAYLGPSHIRLGHDLILYGRTFRVYDADPWTKQWLEHHQLVDNSKCSEGDSVVPIDPFHSKNDQAVARKTNDTVQSVSRLVEAAKGKPTKAMLRKTNKMLANMHTVLRFWAVMETPTENESPLFQVRFFVADDSIEVCREKTAGLGYDMPAMLLRRQPLPRDFKQSGSAQIGADESDGVEYVSELELAIGNVLNVFGRRLRLVRSDQFTKKYFKTVHGWSDDQLKDEEIAAEKPEPVRESARPAPLSLAMGESRRKRQPHRGPSFQMRFETRLVSSKAVDRDRRFILTFDTGTEDLSVFERSQPNSGFTAGKMMEKCNNRINPDTGSPFCANDLFVGATVTINAFQFNIEKADEATLRYLNTNKILSQNGNLDAIRIKLQGVLAQKTSAARMFRELDTDRNCKISKSELGSLLERLDWHLSQHQLDALFQPFDRDGDGQVNLQEFLTLI